MSDTHNLNENVTPNSEAKQYWADLLSPARRRCRHRQLARRRRGSRRQSQPHRLALFRRLRPRLSPARRGQEALGPPDHQPAHASPQEHPSRRGKRPAQIAPALVRKWSIERFPVELGNWNLELRGPHITPSFYFRFTNDLLTILLHPKTDDPRADHLYYTLWVNRSQPVNADNMRKPAPGQPAVEPVLPNTKPTGKLEV